MTVIRPRDRTLRSGDDLARAGLIDRDDIGEADAVAARYAVAVTPHIAAQIDRRDPDDPIARQFLPDLAELDAQEGERADPIGDEKFSPVKGVTHRYPDRVLLKPVLTCPVYCRFCFRREVVGPTSGLLTAAELDAAIGYIAGDSGIWEVILSGGDPLMLSDRRLGDILRRLDAIPHVQVIRIHSRVPLADPVRITPELAALMDLETPVYMVLHCNHPRELTGEARAACRILSRGGIPLLSQTVLLKGVNDDPATLEALMRALVRNRIRPYYLHHADMAPGTGRFRTTIRAGQALMRALRGAVSGLCQPTYVLDIPGGHGKVPIGPAYLSSGAADTVTDPHGRIHRYSSAAG